MLYSLGMDHLSDLDAAILDFEENAPRSISRKEEAIRARLDISPVRYHQRLNLLLDAPAAAESHPLLVARLRRLREERENTRRAARENTPLR
ncbi:DUF3263 domain-containing protein [Corynebacterium macginleyi]|uniref:DUF3263 domain-containing protein n=1 Tax=Corynebacterium macginleyi TaxID=38290 RepID=UPI00190AA4AB|nr:DUF3263 domain-containing protein [Corynebacterium macginleyi]MBK4144240.1 DUF3263 domain-containing protein [Corynebacterium macginleyi]